MSPPAPLENIILHLSTGEMGSANIRASFATAQVSYSWPQRSQFKIDDLRKSRKPDGKVKRLQMQAVPVEVPPSGMIFGKSRSPNPPKPVSRAVQPNT
jgi:hypothetical protein